MGWKHKFFESGGLAGHFPTEDLDARIVGALRHMSSQATSKVEEQVLSEDISRELSRKVAAKTLDYLAAQGIEIRQACMMDLGAGLGMLSEEAAFRGANPVAIEPGSGLGDITLGRIRRSGRGAVISARGENLPFRDGSFDVIVSLQMLEHVEHPAAVLREVYRILKPGGWFYLSCPNYLSFHEGHYNVVWLPLLPKKLGSLYLRLRGKPTEFLTTSITYTTLPWVRRTLIKCGFLSVRERNLYELCRSPVSIKSFWKQRIIRAARLLISADALARALAFQGQITHMFVRNFSELVQKPDVQHYSVTCSGTRGDATSRDSVSAQID